MQSASLKPGNEIFLRDTAEGIAVAKTVGINSIQMMNDPDHSRRLTAHNPDGGVVSPAQASRLHSTSKGTAPRAIRGSLDIDGAPRAHQAVCLRDATLGLMANPGASAPRASTGE